MNAEIIFVLTLLAATVGLFLIDRIRMDMVALLVVAVLALSGLISPGEAVSGFGNPLVVMIAALFVVGEGLFRTGVAAAAGQWLLRVGGSDETRLLAVLIPLTALLSAFMSSTGAVALLLPVVLSMARRSGMNPARLLIPLAYASLVGGMLTLIGTPPNLVVASQMSESGMTPFGFFDFTPIGLVVLLVAGLYLIFVARHLLPTRIVEKRGAAHPPLAEFAQRYDIADQLHLLAVPAGSGLAGKTAAEAALRTRYEVTLFGIRRAGRLLSTLVPVLAESRIEAGDRLLVYGSPEAVEQLCLTQRLSSLGFPEAEMERARKEFGVAEVALRRRSSLIGKTLKEGRFRERFQLSVIGVRRTGQPLATQFGATCLEENDTLLLAGGWNRLRELQQERDFVLLDTPEEMEDVPSHGQRAPLALAIMFGMLVLMVSGLTSNLTAVLLAALAMIGSGCVTLPEAYRSLNATSLVLIAGLLPLALAMERSGALALIVDQLVAGLGDAGPRALCVSLFLLTSVFSQFISNTATTVLVAPIAIATAQQMGVNPEPVLMTVALAASTAFATPIASPVNTLVLAPGNYRFLDFAKVGVPLQLLAMGMVIWLTPLLFPF
ncbi:SLC13 family permease [Marinobacter sp. VGCF2001]|uniref:SLC13 family permease n=1 Tax=Marinobacter sp. VGCF2001 TaxID=3417189 RepID=UPI003CFA1E48